MRDKRFKKIVFPERLWTPGFTYWWIISLATVFMFDIFWMLQTTFRPMSYFAFYPTLFLSAFFLSLPALFDKKGVIQTIWLLFFDLLFIANLMYCRTYYNAIPLQSYGLACNLADFQSSVADSFKWYFIFLPILSLGAFWFYIVRSKPVRRYPSPLIYLIYVAVIGIVLWASDAWRGGIMKRMEFMSNYAYLSSSITPIYSLGGFLVHDYFKSTEKLQPEDLEAVNEWLAEHEKYSKDYWNDSLRWEKITSDKLHITGLKPKNLILILCESLESWVIDATVENQVITPNINSWIADSTTFYASNVVTQVGSGRSIEGQLLILTGLMPMYNKVYAYSAVDNNFLTLPKAFTNTDGKAIIMTADKPYVWNQARVAPAFGFENLIDAEDFNINETTGRTKRLSDGSLMTQISEKLSRGNLWPKDKKFFMTTVTNSGHNPFDLPDHLRTISFKGDFPKIIKDYMVTARYTDSALKTLIDYLRSRSDWEETMVVITGDHEGLASDRKTAISNEISRQFVDPLQHTPLIILNSPIAGEYTAQLGQVDIYSTLVDLIGLSDYDWKGLGFSVFDPVHPGVAVNSAGELIGDRKGDTGEITDHISKAHKVSDLILKFNLLAPEK